MHGDPDIGDEKPMRLPSVSAPLSLAVAQRKIEYLFALQQCSQDIGPAPKLEHVLKLITQRLAQLLRLDHTLLIERDPATRELTVAASHGLSHTGTGEEMLVTAVVRDISERRQVERELRRQAQALEAQAGLRASWSTPGATACRCWSPAGRRCSGTMPASPALHGAFRKCGCGDSAIAMGQGGYATTFRARFCAARISGTPI